VVAALTDSCSGTTSYSSRFSNGRRFFHREPIEQQVTGLGHHWPGHDEAFIPERVEGLYGAFVVSVQAVGECEPDPVSAMSMLAPA
jgi:hypothetical protein